ncbi:MAG: terpene cyclase/mutase family protein [Planctomycetaceae bacterium]|jgi:squalene-hopene/tetraprenyl-beta-curcumene cyclase|nr:terpene cyclase/mutase family protein [Planctomycetaceae bacterium]
MNNRRTVLVILIGLVSLPLATGGFSQEKDSGGITSQSERDVQDRMQKAAVAFLRQSQAPDGSFSAQAGPGVTGLVASALLSIGVPEEDPMVRKSIEYLLKTKKDNGGLHAEGSRHANYETCLAMMALSKINKDGKFDQVLTSAQKFVKGEQWDEGEGISPKDPAFGGAGYGSKSRPDLSNTAFFIEALRSTGVAESDPAIQRALAFVNRCQNLESPANDTPFASKLNDGGFYYTPANGGDSMAGKDEATGGLRSYASMTYAGLKSMLYAGVSPEDYRVKAAVKYLSKNYSVTSNPGMGPAGLYYYLQTMSKALGVMGRDSFETQDGARPWKKDVIEQLSKTQKVDGSWTNPEPRWMEGDPNLVTAYALLTLANLNAQ